MVCRYIRKLLVTRSWLFAVAMSLPALASVVALVTYTLTGHPFNPAVVFTSLTLFNLLRLPLMFLRMSRDMSQNIISDVSFSHVSQYHH